MAITVTKEEALAILNTSPMTIKKVSTAIRTPTANLDKGKTMVAAFVIVLTCIPKNPKIKLNRISIAYKLANLLFFNPSRI